MKSEITVIENKVTNERYEFEIHNVEIHNDASQQAPLYTERHFINGALESEPKKLYQYSGINAVYQHIDCLTNKGFNITKYVKESYRWN